MAGVDPIIISFHDSLLRKSDIKLLNGPYWLNDKIIGFMFEYFEKIQFKNESEKIAFISPEVAQFLKFSSNEELDLFLAPLDLPNKMFVFLAVNNNEATTAGGSHWSLLVFRKDLNVFLHYDSSNNTNLLSARHIAEKIEPCLQIPRKIDFKMGDCSQQENGYDCGLYVICIAEYICNEIFAHNKLEIHPSNFINYDYVTRKREDIKKIINKLNNS